MTCPAGNSWVTPGLNTPKWVREVLGRLRTRVAGYVDQLADLQLGVLGELAEQSQRSVLQVRERAVGAACAPEAVKSLEGIVGEVHAGHPGKDAGVRELGDLLG